MSVIEAKSLSKHYGAVRALSGVSFSVNKGEVIGLLGPNGAGKTTLMKVLTGYLQPDDGEATVAGADVVSDPLSVQKNLGYLPENAPLYGEMAVQEYLLMMASLRQVPVASQRQMLADAIYATGLEDYLTRRIATLSKGYKQRLGIAQAILHNPELLILDEPTTGLDPTQIVEIRELIKRLSKHSTVMLSTHILSEVEMTCQRAIVIIRGELRADSAIEELSGNANAVVVSIESSATGVASTLGDVAGVTEVVEQSQGDGYTEWRVIGASDDLAPTVFDALRKSSWKISELRPERRSLEAVFHELAASGADDSEAN